MLKFTVHGNPIPKARPRLGQRVYTPDRTIYYEQIVGMAALIAMSEQQIDCFNQPIAVNLIFYRKDKIRVDLDNLIKSVLDGLNQVVWADDYLVGRISAEKRYDKAMARVEIEISPL